MKKSRQIDEEPEMQVDKVQGRDDANAVGQAGGSKLHPSRSLESRARGFGIAAGYERPYRQKTEKPGKGRKGMYGTLPHAGYYGVGMGARPFCKGQAGFSDELAWYRVQYGEATSGSIKLKK